MKCLNCGNVNDYYLCDKCRDTDVLDKIFGQIRFYKPENCENPYLLEYVSTLTEKYAERDIIPEILSYFRPEETEYYYCQYYKMRRDPNFETSAIDYLDKHGVKELKSQRILNDLLESYMPNDFIKPQKWCEIIAKDDNFCLELYATASKFYSMIGEYDLSDTIVEKALKILKQENEKALLFYSPEGMQSRLEKQQADILRYRTKKPYWPTTEERRRAVAMFYDEKGIKYPRIENKPTKIKEEEFEPINECYEDEPTEYCAFWCSEAFSLSAVKSIHSIAAVKVREGVIVDKFESLVRPWDGSVSRKSAAKELNIPLEEIEGSDDVDLVLSKFFEFVGNDVLVSTGALGNQVKLISRAARYSGMKNIKNEFFDLLDMAADVSEEFDLENNTRGYLLSYFELEDGKKALEKAVLNKELYDKLKKYGD